MFILKTGHQPGVYVPLRALFLVSTIGVKGLVPLEGISSSDSRVKAD